MHPSLLVVEAVVATPADDTNIRDDCWSIALDQRAFGPRRLLVAFSHRSGRLLGIAHAPRTEPPEVAFACCVDRLGRGAAAAIVYCDEPVSEGPPPPALEARFHSARAVCARQGVHLVDWIMCDDQVFRSIRLGFDSAAEWWNVP